MLIYRRSHFSRKELMLWFNKWTKKLNGWLHGKRSSSTIVVGSTCIMILFHVLYAPIDCCDFMKTEKRKPKTDQLENSGSKVLGWEKSVQYDDNTTVKQPSLHQSRQGEQMEQVEMIWRQTSQESCYFWWKPELTHNVIVHT